jgi:hypothetical protein
MRIKKQRKIIGAILKHMQAMEEAVVEAKLIVDGIQLNVKNVV